MPSPKNPTMLTPKRAVPSMSFSHIRYCLGFVAKISPLGLTRF